MLNKKDWIKTYNNFTDINDIYNQAARIESLVEDCSWLKKLYNIQIDDDNVGNCMDVTYDKIINPLLFLIDKACEMHVVHQLDLLLNEHNPMFDDMLIRECFYEMINDGKTSIDFECFANEEDELKGIVSEKTIKITTLEDFYDIFIYFNEDMF